MKNAVLWIRVSSVMQADGFSLDSQEDQLTKAAKDFNVVRTFRVTESAKTSERRKAFEMVEYIKANQIGHLFAWSVNRLTRNYKDLYLIQSLIDEHDLTVTLVKENRTINKDSPGHERFVFQMLGNLAELDNKERADDVREKMQEKARQGGWAHKAPIGYLNVTDPMDTNPIVERRRKIVIPDLDRATLVTWAFETFAKGGWSLQTMADELRRRGLTTLPTPARPAHPLDSNGVHLMLRNPFYCGRGRSFGKENDGIHKPIVTKEVWQAVQAQLDGNRMYEYPGTRRWFAFKPFLRCGYCGSGISAYQSKGGKYRYYVCSENRHKLDPEYYEKTFGTKHCRLKSWREEKINKLIEAEIGKLYLDDILVDQVRERLKRTSLEDEAIEERERRRLEAEKARKEKHLKTSYYDRLNENITIERYKEIVAETQADLDCIKIEIERLGRRNTKAREQGVQVLDLLKDVKKVYNKVDLVGKRRLLEVMMSYVNLRPDDEHSVVWRWPFSAFFTLGEELINAEIRSSKTRT